MVPGRHALVNMVLVKLGLLILLFGKVKVMVYMGRHTSVELVSRRGRREVWMYL